MRWKGLFMSAETLGKPNFDLMKALQKGNERLGREIEEKAYEEELDEILDKRKPFNDIVKTTAQGMVIFSLLTGPAHLYRETHKEELKQEIAMMQEAAGIVVAERTVCDNVQRDRYSERFVKPIAVFTGLCEQGKVQVATGFEKKNL